jgi:hypothetical protein
MNKKYKPPKCDCGAFLFLWHEEMHTTKTFITKRGTLYKRSSLLHAEPGAWDRLKCSSCSMEYGIDIDEEKRISRGEAWE